ncbi:MAG: hypothetical protein ACOCXA_01270 [Planctomycetota bacterium]
MAARARLIGFEVVLPLIGLLLTIPPLALHLRLGGSPVWALSALFYVLPIVWGLRRLVLVRAGPEDLSVGGRNLAADAVVELVFERRGS